MITQETAQKIWAAYQAINAANKLISEMKEQLEKTGDPNLIDPFGRKRQLELGVPCGDIGHRIYNVRPDLALRVIEAHIEDQKMVLNQLEVIVKLEMKVITQ